MGLEAYPSKSIMTTGILSPVLPALHPPRTLQATPRQCWAYLRMSETVDLYASDFRGLLLRNLNYHYGLVDLRGPSSSFNRVLLGNFGV